jgi:hypothetical protein
MSLANKSSTSRHHRSGDSTPPCGQALDIAIHMENPLRFATKRDPPGWPKSTYNGVITPMPEKSTTHGIITGIVECSFDA